MTGAVVVGVTAIIGCVAIVAIVFGRSMRGKVNQKGIEIDVDG